MNHGCVRYLNTKNYRKRSRIIKLIIIAKSLMLTGDREIVSLCRNVSLFKVFKINYILIKGSIEYCGVYRPDAASA